jgi:ATP-dependent exoDNAse (exonuclease V) beta subunit
LLITTHKSKGLAFPVVILPLRSSPKVDNPHPDPFWFHSAEEPWNAFPVYSARSSAGFLSTSLGYAFQDETYANALEELNILYVACTRARYGLVLLLDIPGGIAAGGGAAKSGSKNKKEHLRHKTGRLIVDASQKGTFPVPFACTWDQNGSGLLESGIVAPVVYPGEETMPGHLLNLQPVFPDAFAFPVAAREMTTEEQEVGTLVHRVLEQTRDAADWENGLNRIIGHDLQKDPRVESARKILATGFSEPALREWFDPGVPAWPELEIQNESGERVRADRLVKREEGWVVLDFKTGEPREADRTQIAGYARLCTTILGEPVRACLLYWTRSRAEWVETV